jgi:transposase
MGLDSHKNFSRVTARDRRGAIAWRQRLEHADRTILREQLAAWPRGLPVVLEGTFGWGWLAEELSAAGQKPHLASSKKVAAWREARGLPKCNRVDADLLSELWSEPGRWWEVWLAPPEVRDRREWLRYRMGLVQLQTLTKNRIHATLHRHGIVHGLSDLFGRKGWALLTGLSDEQDATLRDSARRTLFGHLKLLKQLRKQIAEVTRELRKQVSAHAQAECWRSLPGVSWVLAYTIFAEVGEAGRFKDGRHLASYALLAPRADESGDESNVTPTGRHVGRAGRRTLKWALIEAAHGAVRRSAHFKAVFDRRTDGGKKDRNRGYIAVAHALARVGFACCRHGTSYSEQAPPRPGSRPAEGQAAPAKESSRSGLGQPEDPMAGAAL